MRTDPGEQIIFRGHPSWLSMKGFVVRGLALSLVAGVAAGAATTVATGHPRSALVVAAVLAAFLLVFLRGQGRRMRTTYTVTNRRLTIERGLVSRRLQQAPLEHIQDMRMRQSLTERALGIGTVDVATAGEAGGWFRLHGVEDPAWVVGMIDRAQQRRYEAWEVPRAWEAPVGYATPPAVL